MVHRYDWDRAFVQRVKPVFDMLMDLSDSDGKASDRLGSIAAINDM